MDKRDRIIATLAQALGLVDPAGLDRALRRAEEFPGQSFDRVLVATGALDLDGHQRLIAAFNERLQAARGPAPPPAPPAPPARPRDRRGRQTDVIDVPLPPQPPRPPRPPVPPLLDDSSGELPGFTAAPRRRAAPLEPAPAPAPPPSADFPGRLLDESSDEQPVPFRVSGVIEPSTVLREEEDLLDLEVPLESSDETDALDLAPAGGPIAASSPLPASGEVVIEPSLTESGPLELAPDEPPSRPVAAAPGLAEAAFAAEDELPVPPGDVLDEEEPGSGFDLRLQRDVDPADRSAAPQRSARRKGQKLTRRELKRRLKAKAGFEGLILGDYLVHGEIARGAFGVVLEVEAEGLTKRVAEDRGYTGHLALKVALENRTDPRETERFLDEVRVQIGFNHPHIVRIFDAGVEDGVTYYSMERIQGIHTRAYVEKHGPMPPLLAVRIAQEIATALAYVHGKRIYHRDLKPQNVMLDQAAKPYRAVLIDFGLVTEFRSTKDKGLIVGTPSYMPPEQAQPRGGHGEINATTDVYSLGATLFFLLTGRAPFPGRDPRQIIKRVVSEAPPDPAELNPQVTRRIADLCLRCLQKAQRDRFHSSKLLADELDRELRSGQRKIKARSILGKLLGKKK